MRVVKIEFDESEDIETITVALTVAEAAFIATFTGNQSGETAEAVMRGGSEASSHLYEGMTGGVFNRWYDAGVTEWVEGQA